MGGVTYVSGQFGQAFNFDGTDYVKIPDAPNLNPTSTFTVEGWIRPVFAGRPAYGADIDTVFTKIAPSYQGYGLFLAMDPSFPFFSVPAGGVKALLIRLA